MQRSSTCPNCGHTVTGNFCAHCGQEAQLHKETFTQMLLHFVGHYLHYDSKFLKSLKTLWTRPGALTVAYLKEQRVKYTAPIPLYIFTSAIFFICYFSFHVPEGTINIREIDRTASALPQDTLSNGKGFLISTQPNSALNRFIAKTKKVAESNGKTFEEYLLHKVTHNTPKVFFFMIPFMALVLHLLFFRRKTFQFVDHAVFSLHYHTLLFSVVLLAVINPFPVLVEVLAILIFLFLTYSFVRSVMKVYTVSFLKSLLCFGVVAIIYALFILLAMIANVLLAIALS